MSSRVFKELSPSDSIQPRQLFFSWWRCPGGSAIAPLTPEEPFSSWRWNGEIIVDSQRNAMNEWMNEWIFEWGKRAARCWAPGLPLWLCNRLCRDDIAPLVQRTRTVPLNWPCPRLGRPESCQQNQELWILTVSGFSLPFETQIHVDVHHHSSVSF